MPTITDIAVKTGLARTTVAEILRNRPGYSERTRKRVLQVAEQMQYRPNYLSKALAGGKSMAIGVIPCSLQARIAVLRLRSIEARAARNGYITYMVGWGEDHDQRLPRYVREVIDRRVDGIIVYNAAPPSKEAVEAIEKSPVPVVYIYHAPEGERQFVGIDSAPAIADLCTHLSEVGYQSAGFIHSPFERAHPHRKFDPFCRELAARGIRLDASESWIADPDKQHSDNGYDIVTAQAKHGLPDVLISYNDEVAAGALAALHDAGIRPGEKVGVTGFDDIPIATVVRPKLTTIHQPRGEVGQIAFDMLHELMDNRDASVRAIHARSTFVLRDSTRTR